MKKVAGLLIAGSMLFSAHAVSYTDFILEAKQIDDPTPVLTENDEISSFWKSWSGLDSLYMDVYDFSTSLYEDDDCSVTLKLAASKKGLYVYASVSDNAFSDAPADNPDSWKFDAVDMFFNAEVSDTIRAKMAADPQNNTMYFSGGGGHTTASTQIAQVLGGTADPTFVRFNTGNSDLGIGSPLAPSFDTELDDLRKYGVLLDVVNSGDKKEMEWFIPWALIQADNVKLAQNDGKMAFTCGYNDLDGGDLLSFVTLRWKKEAGDPFKARPNGVNAWGDMQIPKTLLPLEIIPIVSNKFNVNNKKSVQGKVAKVEYFTLTGKKIPAAQLNNVKRTSVIERKVLTNGNVQVTKIMNAR